MDQGSPINDSKTQELSKEHSMNKGRNKLCNLPDIVLQHILSFLGPKMLSEQVCYQKDGYICGFQCPISTLYKGQAK